MKGVSFFLLTLWFHEHFLKKSTLHKIKLMHFICFLAELAYERLYIGNVI